MLASPIRKNCLHFPLAWLKNVLSFKPVVNFVINPILQYITGGGAWRIVNVLITSSLKIPFTICGGRTVGVLLEAFDSFTSPEPTRFTATSRMILLIRLMVQVLMRRA
ncbi:hypothetical protein JG688_00015767 [Phytophthora aleatoria]|uniref:Uncharacterized protein n=1 Tax=Phytophthora aleatoria TaxID=2496075 RepID=A0A8J5M2H5_9STRA|nr:hypothetical protein JG688_00015767 [Phytophthora aleatoria]